MLKSKYRTVVAAVLVGAALFSPLLCGMPCLEAPVKKTIAAAKAAPDASEFMGDFAGSALVGCVLSHLVSKIDFGEWADQVDVVTWVWVGVDVLRLSDEAWLGEVWCR